MGYVNAIYYPSWAVYKDKTPSKLAIQHVTHVLYAFVGVNKDGTLHYLDEWADLQKEVDGEKGCLAALAKVKLHHPHLKILVSLGGATWSKEFPAMAAQPEARRRLARDVSGMMARYNFDGVDIDWEHPKNGKEGGDYVQLLRDLRDSLPTPRYLVTTALPVGEYCLKHIDLAEAARVLDLLFLMSYDFTGSWTQVAGHHAQLLPPPHGHVCAAHAELRVSSSGGVQYLLTHGVPATKVILGVPVYARHFPKAGAAGHKFKKAGDVDYCDLREDWVQRANVDQQVVAASFVDESREGKGFLSFDTPETVRQKASFVQARGLGGLFYWHGAGDRQGGQSLVIAGDAALRRH